MSRNNITNDDRYALNIDIGTEEAYHKFLHEICEGGLLKDEHYASIRHGVERFCLEGVDGKGEMKTGNLRPNDVEKECPYTFYKFSIDGRLVEKALVNYLNPECDEIAPTIEAVEVLERYHGMHIGCELIRLIEAKASAAGFSKVIAHNIVEERKFWNNHGYSDVRKYDGIKILSEKNGEGE